MHLRIVIVGSDARKALCQEVGAILSRSGVPDTEILVSDEVPDLDEASILVLTADLIATPDQATEVASRTSGEIIVLEAPDSGVTDDVLETLASRRPTPDYCDIQGWEASNIAGVVVDLVREMRR